MQSQWAPKPGDIVEIAHWDMPRTLHVVKTVFEGNQSVLLDPSPGCTMRWSDLRYIGEVARPGLVNVTLGDGRTGAVNPSWLAESADTVEWRWRRFVSSRDPLSQADALNLLSDAVSDLATFLPGYNLNTGEVERPGDEL